MSSNIAPTLKLLHHLTDPIPPFMVFAIARKKMPDGSWKRGMTIEEVSEASGLSVRTCARVAAKLTWAREKQFVIDAFCKGCGFSFFDAAEQKKYIIRSSQGRAVKFAHLNGIRRTFLERRCQEFIKLKGKKSE